MRAGRKRLSIRRWRRIRILEFLNKGWTMQDTADAAGTFPREVRRVGRRYLQRGLEAPSARTRAPNRRRKSTRGARPRLWCSRVAHREAVAPRRWRCNNWGAVTGGMAGLTLRGSVVVSAIGGGLASTAGGGVSRAVQRGNPQMSLQNMSVDCVAGAVLGPGRSSCRAAAIQSACLPKRMLGRSP